MSRLPVRFMIRSADAPGGVTRSVLTLAGDLAEDHDVEVVSLFRRRTTPAHPVPPGVRLSYLQDHRRSNDPVGNCWRRLSAPLLGRPSRLVHPADSLHQKSDALTDIALVRSLRSMRSGVLVTTRPSLLAVAARFAPRDLVIVGQEHMNADTRPQPLQDLVRTAANRAGALVVLTERDKQDWERRLGQPGAPPVHVIPNPVPWPVGHDGRTRRHLVVAVGRLVRQKGFDRLIEAWPAVVARHPDWRLHIYGDGEEREALQSLITRRGMTGRVELKGWSDRIDEVLSDASVFALSSRFEGLPMVMLEALGRGVPVVSFDCPRGPRDLITDGVDGLLVDDGDIAGFSDALVRVLDDDTWRWQLGRRALETAARYALPAIGDRWRLLLDGLVSGGSGSASTSPHALPPTTTVGA